MIKEFFKGLKNNKRAQALSAVILILIIICLFLVPENSNNSETTVIDNTVENDELEKVLSNIKGAGKVSVMITYSSGSESVCAVKTEKQTSTVTEQSENGTRKQSETVVENSNPITVGSGEGEDALVVLEKEPVIRGVIVVAEGAGNVGVKLELQRAVETVLQISPDKVEIFEMN